MLCSSHTSHFNLGNQNFHTFLIQMFFCTADFSLHFGLLSSFRSLKKELWKTENWFLTVSVHSYLLGLHEAILSNGRRGQNSGLHYRTFYMFTQKCRVTLSGNSFFQAFDWPTWWTVQTTIQHRAKIMCQLVKWQKMNLILMQFACVNLVWRKLWLSFLLFSDILLTKPL